MKRTSIYLIITIWLTLAGQGVGQGVADEFDQARQYAIDLINQIRTDPAAYAQGLGVTDAQVAADLPLLTLNAGVSEAAGRENRGEAAEDTNWSTPAVSKSFSGVVSFLNFMRTEKAIQVVVNNQFLEEAAPGYSGSKVILNPNLSQAGAAISVGVKGSGGIWYNAYAVTITLTSTLTRVQRQLLNLVNQLRYDPASSGLGWSDHSDSEWALPVYSPIFSDPGLQVAANALVLDPLGCDADTSGGLCRSAGVLFPRSDLDTTVGWLFSSVLLDELKADDDSGILFRNGVNALGTGITLAEGLEYTHIRSVLVGRLPEPASEEDIAAEAETISDARVYGLAYADEDGNGLYSPGEGWTEGSVAAYDTESLVCVADTTTDAAGHFDLSLPLNRTYWIQVNDDTGKTAWGQVYLDQNRYLPVRYVAETIAAEVAE